MVLASLAALSWFATDAEAATKETFSGTLCESVYNVNSIYGEDVDYQYGAIINRSSTYWGYVDCPVPRANGYTSGTVADLEVSVSDPTGGDMWCTAYVADRFGVQAGSATVYAASTVGDQILDFQSVPGAPYEGTLRMFCVLPPNGGTIHSYVVDFN